MDYKTVETFILSMPHARLDFPFGPDVAVYKVGTADDAKMFALIAVGSDPIRLSLKCDPQLALTLREQYETVQPGYHLHKKHWNTLLLTGQLDRDQVEALIQHSYDLVIA